MAGKIIQCLPNPRSMYLSMFNSFQIIRCLSQRVSPKIAIFTTFLFPLGTLPGAITLNVVWMETEFDAYKLSRWMCLSNYNRFWDRARYWSRGNKNVVKIAIFGLTHWLKHLSYPLAFDAPVRGGSCQNSATPFGVEKLEWCGYPKVKKFRRYLYSFWHNSRTWQTHRQPDTQTPHAGIYRAYAYASRGNYWQYQ